jgi:hypothetical protein
MVHIKHYQKNLYSGALPPSHHPPSPENISFIEVHEDEVGPEFCFAGTDHLLLGQIVVEFLQGLQTLGQVLIIDLKEL